MMSTTFLERSCHMEASEVASTLYINQTYCSTKYSA
jgi:hypothetical protein